jgi:hypothetical protein
MFSPLRNRFGIPGVISVIALVFAMLGGAYAASDSGSGKATASAKGKPGPRGPRGKTGPAGPAGPAGAQGPAGAKGDSGAAGANGKDGTNGTNGTPGTAGATGTPGKSVKSFPIDPGPTDTQCDEQGGTEFEVEGSVEPPTVACNGKEGSPWTLGGTLPKGSTETGTWAFNATAANEEFLVPISFPIKVKAGVEASKIHFGVPSDPEFHSICTAAQARKPTAPEGHLCIYFSNSSGAEITYLGTKEVNLSSEGANEPGAVMVFDVAEPGYMTGTWAVTAE